MTTRDSQSDSVPFSKNGRSSHRTGPEQLVGLGIYLSIALGFAIVSGLKTHFLSMVYALFLALGMWALWRKVSLRLLFLEISLFASQFLLQLFWGISHFLLGQSLLSLVALLLLSCNTLMIALLLWRKEKISGALYFFPLLWVFYWTFINMITCMSNPGG